ncbi:MAG: hypothetical protein FJ288_11305 [Planctomycetes bacterium]|nr:hypothetical protein [Planctomycetota bacterium]
MRLELVGGLTAAVLLIVMAVASGGAAPAVAPAKPSGAAVPASAAPSAAPGVAEPVSSPPAKTKADNPGRIIRGRLTPPERVKEAFLWERSMDLRVPVAVDPKTGEFEVRGLRLGTYNFIIRTPWGRLEGIDMAPKVSEYDILIPPEYRTEDLGRAPEGTLSEDDKKSVRRIIHEVKRYENKIRDLYLAGCSDRAVALMECLMDAPFHSEKGDEVTWRIEQWYYEKKYDAWTTFRTRVLYRFRQPKAVWQTWGWQFEPTLGGLDIAEDRKDPLTVEFAIPDRPVPEKGLAGNQYPPAEKGMPKEPRPPEADESR